MTTEEHLRMLKQGVEAWNKWREENPDMKPELSEANLLLANLSGANLQWANLGGADLRAANLNLANLRGAFLVSADLREARLELASLQSAELVGANLQKADLWRANLQGANLSAANLTQVDLRAVESIENVFLCGTTLDCTQLTKDQLGGAIGEELRGWSAKAKETYLALKNNWEQMGHYDDASWAYRKERRMEKKEALEKAIKARQERKWGDAARSYAKVSGDWFVELVCDYGESFWRVLTAMSVVWLGFALVYGLASGVCLPWQQTATGSTRYVTYNPLHLLSFSLGAMTTLLPSGLEARPTLVMQILTPFQALLGIALAGLLGFVAGNRIRRSEGVGKRRRA